MLCTTANLVKDKSWIKAILHAIDALSFILSYSSLRISLLRSLKTNKFLKGYGHSGFTV